MATKIFSSFINLLFKQTTYIEKKENDYQCLEKKDDDYVSNILGKIENIDLDRKTCESLTDSIQQQIQVQFNQLEKIYISGSNVDLVNDKLLYSAQKSDFVRRSYIKNIRNLAGDKEAIDCIKNKLIFTVSKYS